MSGSSPGPGADATVVDPSASTYLPGTALNPRFRVVRTVGRRGLLELIEVEDLLRRCRRAARLLPHELADDTTALARLRREAEAGASVEHPGVLAVEGLERADDGSLFVVTELFEGAPLTDRIAAGPLPVAVAVEIAQKVAAALAAIHRTQLVHRDLKPSGIMVSGEDGRLEVKLIDFGLVKATGDWDATRLTQTVGLLGSPEYMSPEHILRPHELDARADVYALGVVLYEMLVGAPPFSNVAFGPVLQMHLKQPPPDPRERRREIPAVIAECVLRAMAKSPDQRFATARQLAAALNFPTAPRSSAVAVPSRAEATPSRRPWLWAAPVALLAVGGGVWLAATRARAPSPLPAPAVIATAETSTAPPAAARVASPPPTAALPAGALFGGRPLPWWASELSALRDQPGAEARERFARLTARAQANELVIDAAGPTVDVQPARDLAELARLRWRGKPVATDSSTTAARTRADLAPLADAIAAQFARDQAYRTSPRHPQVRLAPRPATSGVLHIQFAAGAYHDGDSPGLTRVGQVAMLAASTRGRYADLVLDVDRAGGELRVQTGLTDSAITLEAASPEFDALAARLIRMCLAPELAVDRLPDARERALRGHDDGDLDELSSVLAERAFDGPGFDSSPRGDPDTIRALTASDLRRHYAGPLSPANATVVVAGAFDATRVRAALSAVAGGTPAPFVRPTRDPTGTYRLAGYDNVRLVAYPVTFVTPPEAAAAHLAAALIEERLFEQFRAEGVAYSVSVAPHHQRWLDYVLVAVPFASHAPDVIGDRITAEVDLLAREGLTAEAILRNQRAVMELLDATSRSPSRLAGALAMSDGIEWNGPAVARALAELTPERLAAIVRPWLDARRTVQLEVSPTALERRKSP